MAARRFGIKQREQPFTAADEARWQAAHWQLTYHRLRYKSEAEAAQAIRERDEWRRRACALEQGVSPDVR